MQILSCLKDKRINATNVLIEISVGEYLSHARAAINKNEFQRKRIQGSRSIYSQLKNDLLQGCVIPAIVLATSHEFDPNVTLNSIQDSLLILDGLQRTYTLLELVDQLDRQKNTEDLEQLLALHIRAEIYFGATKSAVLYRMLTLNTGQTPMSLRQQLEMLYSEYLEAPINNLKLIKETDNLPVSNRNEYSFRDAIDGFNSYIERDELTLDRADLLENIKNLEALSRSSSKIDLFSQFLHVFDDFLSKVESIIGNVGLGEDYTDHHGVPWGETTQDIFKRSQAMTGFGAAIGKLQDKDILNDFAKVEDAIQQLQLSCDPQQFLIDFNSKMLDLKKRAKKIGNSQRMFFSYYFRELLNPQTDWYCDLSKALQPAYQKFESQTF